MITRNTLVDDLRRVSKKLRGASVSRRVYRSLGKHASSTIEDHFYSWSKAKTAARIK